MTRHFVHPELRSTRTRHQRQDVNAIECLPLNHSRPLRRSHRAMVDGVDPSLRTSTLASSRPPSPLVLFVSSHTSTLMLSMRSARWSDWKSRMISHSPSNNGELLVWLLLTHADRSTGKVSLPSTILLENLVFHVMLL